MEFAAAAALGLLWGSFLNVVIYRLPQTAAADSSARRSLTFLAWPRSFCPACGESIPAWRNIPLLSYIFLLGKAPCCGKRISPWYPLGEVLGAATIIWPLAHFGFGVDAALAMVFLSFLLVMSGIDMQRRRLLPPILLMPLMWIGLLANIDARFALLSDAVLGAAGGYLGLLLLGQIFEYVFRFWHALLFSREWKKQAIGGDDPVLMATLGAWLGWQDLPLLLFLASLFGVIMSCFRFFTECVIRKKRRKFWDRYIGFGPCLGLAGALMLFYGDDLLFAYLDFFTRW